MGPHNYAFSIGGPADTGGETLPIALTIGGPTYDAGKHNPRDPIAGYSYENPMIGSSNGGDSCTNDAPKPWMTHLRLHATVSGLKPGHGYNLYEYEFGHIEGKGMSAALAVPVSNFNANAAMAKNVTSFTRHRRELHPDDHP